MRILLLSLLTLISVNIYSQSDSDKKEIKSSDLSAFKFRSIGPAMISGRISDLAVNPENFSEYYVAVASGGVFKTTNSGISYKPIFDSQKPYSIGCVSIAKSNSNIVWVGTGENNSQRSVSFGDGVYKSLDGGKTWKNVGLKKSEHIGNIVIHPENENVVYVAAQGPLWGPGGDRGVYKTTDGGENWERVLYISENTGVNEVHMDTRNPNILYASSYQRRRHVYTLINGGPESAIYKSIDAGKTWRILTKGLPKVDMGKIGLAIANSNPDYIYAIIEAAEDKGGIFKSTDRGESWSKQNSYVSNSPQYYNELFVDPTNENILYSMDTYAKISVDGGKNWSNLSNTSRHVDDHALWINPENTSHLLIGGDGGVYESFDRGEKWDYKQNLPLAQFYRVELDNDKPFYNVYGGTQDNNSVGGPSQTFNNNGVVNSDWFILHGGDGFEPQIDPENPNIIYAQSQHGWLARYNKLTGEEIMIKPSEPNNNEAYRWNWDSPLIISSHDNKTLYFAANKVFKSINQGNEWKVISPDLTRQLDRNLLKVMGKIQSPEAVSKNASTSLYGNIVSLAESSLKQGLLYVGTDDGQISVSENDGESWRTISEFDDVSKLSYVSDIIASKFDENIVYASFVNYKNNDFKPYILKSDDKGKSWESISSNLPEDEFVWSLDQDHKNSKLLFAGTEFGIYFSMDEGKKWIKLKSGIPSIAIRDIDIQESENDLAVATFGRGFYILDDYSALRDIQEIIHKDTNHIFQPKNGKMFIYRKPFGGRKKGHFGDNFYTAENPKQGVNIKYYLNENFVSLKDKRKKIEKEKFENNEDIEYQSFEEFYAEDFEINEFLIFIFKDEVGNEVRRLKAELKRGLNSIVWDLKYPNTNPVKSSGKKSDISNNSGSAFVIPGKYSVEMVVVGKSGMRKIGNKQFFTVENLFGQNQESLNYALEFRKEVLQLNNSIKSVNTELSVLKSKIEKINIAMKSSLNADYKYIYQCRELLQKLDSIDIIMNGNPAKKSRYAAYAPGINARFGQIVWGLSSSMEPATATHKADFAIIKLELNNIIESLEEFYKIYIPELEKELDRINAPHTPGRIIKP